MPKEKESIGISLLDVLTNSFAAALLLMTIVAATVGSGDGDPNQAKPGDGTDYVVSAQFGLDKKLERPDPPVLSILLTFKGGNAQGVKLRAAALSDKTEATIRQSFFRPEQWSVFRRGSIKTPWLVEMDCTGTVPDSLYVLITIGNTGIAPITVPVQKSGSLLEITEPATTDAAIRIFNQPISTLQ